MPFRAAAPVLIFWPRSRLGKFGLHLPLTRQSAVFAQEGVDLDVSTLCDWMGAVAVATQPLSALIAEHVMKAERLHADDTPVPVLAKGKTKTGRFWTVVRDDRPFGGSRSAGCHLLLLAGSQGRASAGLSEDLQRDPAGGRLFRLRAAV